MQLQRQQQTVYHAADKGGGRVKIAFQHHRYPAGQHIADDPSADGGEYSAQHDAGWGQAVGKALFCADGCENSQTDGVANFDDVAFSDPESGTDV